MTPSDDLDFGPRLERKEYEKKCRDLLSELITSKERETASFNLLIDYRLGKLVPQDKRLALLKARNRALFKIPYNIIAGLIKPNSNPTQEVFLQAAKELDKVLSRPQMTKMTDYSVEELEKFLGPQSKRRR